VRFERDACQKQKYTKMFKPVAGWARTIFCIWAIKGYNRDKKTLMDNPDLHNTVQEPPKPSLLSGETLAGKLLVNTVLAVGFLVTLGLLFYSGLLGTAVVILIMAVSFAAIHYFGLGGLLMSLLGLLIVCGAGFALNTKNGEPSSSVLTTGLMLAALSSVVWLLSRARYKEHRMLSDLNQKVAKERERFIALINTIDMAVVATDNEGKITLYNGAALSLLSTNISLSGQLFTNVFQLIDANQQPTNVIGQVKEQKRAIERIDTSVKVGQKDMINLQVIAAPIKSNFGAKSGGYVITLRDITKQKTLDEQRNEFVSVTSHEIRTPIAIIEGTLSTALAGPMVAKAPPEIIKLIKNAHEQTMFLSRLVQDLATLAMAEGEFLDIELKPIDPEKIIQNQFKNHTAEATEKGLNMILQPSVDLHPILTSEVYINEILENFITNAIKYTKEGTIRLGAENAAENSIRFWVEDTGRGVGQADQKKLFTKFFRSEGFETRETGGTGLGLYITKKLAERIGGKVWCTTELGKGSVFYLDVPPIGALKTDVKKITNAEIEDFAEAI
jgi:PAS domain S-box-containing protein